MKQNMKAVFVVMQLQKCLALLNPDINSALFLTN